MRWPHAKMAGGYIGIQLVKGRSQNSISSDITPKTCSLAPSIESCLVLKYEPVDKSFQAATRPRM
jgi:hypothetical protein